MALVFVTAKDDTVINISEYMVVNTSKSAYTLVLDDSSNGVKDLFTNLNSHLLSEIMTGKPYVKLSYDGVNVSGQVMNNNGITQINISILGQVFTVDVSTDTFVFPLILHPSMTDQRLTLYINNDTIPHTFIQVAGLNSNREAAIYKNIDGVYNIVPTKSTDLMNFWQTTLVETQYSLVDLATITGVLVDAVFNYLIPNANLTLPTEEQNGINDIKNNIMPNIASKLNNIIPDGLTGDIHYNSYKLHAQQAKQAMEKYVADKVEISKYIVLK